MITHKKVGESIYYIEDSQIKLEHISHVSLKKDGTFYNSGIPEINTFSTFEEAKAALLKRLDKEYTEKITTIKNSAEADFEKKWWDNQPSDIQFDLNPTRYIQEYMDKFHYYPWDCPITGKLSSTQKMKTWWDSNKAEIEKGK